MGKWEKTEFMFLFANTFLTRVAACLSPLWQAAAAAADENIKHFANKFIYKQRAQKNNTNKHTHSGTHTI